MEGSIIHPWSRSTSLVAIAKPYRGKKLGLLRAKRNMPGRDSAAPSRAGEQAGSTFALGDVRAGGLRAAAAAAGARTAGFVRRLRAPTATVEPGANGGRPRPSRAGRSPR